MHIKVNLNQVTKHDAVDLVEHNGNMCVSGVFNEWLLMIHVVINLVTVTGVEDDEVRSAVCGDKGFLRNREGHRYVLV